MWLSAEPLQRRASLGLGPQIQPHLRLRPDFPFPPLLPVLGQ